MTGGLSVFVASSQDNLPGTAMLSMSNMEQELLGSPQETINNQASEFLMSAMASALYCDGSLSDLFDDMIRENLFVVVDHGCAVVKGRLRENIAFWKKIGASNCLQRVNRLIADLRYINQHLRSCKFKYKDIHTAADVFQLGDWFFKLDYIRGYHHVEIFPEHTKFLGCS